MILKWTRHRDFPDARPPERAHPTDAGLDLFAAADYVLRYNQIYKIRTGICIELPSLCVGLVWDKSGLASKGILTLGGVIDESYRGEIIVLVANIIEQNTIEINKHDKIAQIIVQKVEYLFVDDKPSVLSNTKRGEGGFGSTGR